MSTGFVSIVRHLTNISLYHNFTTKTLTKDNLFKDLYFIRTIFFLVCKGN